MNQFDRHQALKMIFGADQEVVLNQLFLQGAVHPRVGEKKLVDGFPL